MQLMLESYQTIFYWVAAGALIVAGFFILRFILKFAWKIIRVALILLSVLLVAGYFFGFLDNIFH